MKKEKEKQKAERTRNCRLSLRFTEEENKKIKKWFEKGKKEFKNNSNFLLNVMKNSNLTVYKINTSDIIKELRASGNNINQWTKGINTFNEVSREDVKKLKEEIDKIKEYVNKFTMEIKGIKNGSS